MHTVKRALASQSVVYGPLKPVISSIGKIKCNRGAISGRLANLNSFYLPNSVYQARLQREHVTGRGTSKSPTIICAAVSTFDEPWQGSNDVFESMEEVGISHCLGQHYHDSAVNCNLWKPKAVPMTASISSSSR